MRTTAARAKSPMLRMNPSSMVIKKVISKLSMSSEMNKLKCSVVKITP